MYKFFLKVIINSFKILKMSLGGDAIVALEKDCFMHLMSAGAGVPRGGPWGAWAPPSRNFPEVLAKGKSKEKWRKKGKNYKMSIVLISSYLKIFKSFGGLCHRTPPFSILHFQFEYSNPFHPYIVALCLISLIAIITSSIFSIKFITFFYQKMA